MPLDEEMNLIELLRSLFLKLPWQFRGYVYSSESET